MTTQTLEPEVKQDTTEESLDLLMAIIGSLRKDADSALLRLDKLEESRLASIWKNICTHVSEPRHRILSLECAIKTIEIMEKTKADPSRVVTGAEMRERMAALGVVVGNSL